MTNVWSLARIVGLTSYVGSACLVVLLTVQALWAGVSADVPYTAIGAISIVLGSFFLPTSAFLVVYTIYSYNLAKGEAKPHLYLEVIAVFCLIYTASMYWFLSFVGQSA